MVDGGCLSETERWVVFGVFVFEYVDSVDGDVVIVELRELNVCSFQFIGRFGHRVILNRNYGRVKQSVPRCQLLP